MMSMVLIQFLMMVRTVMMLHSLASVTIPMLQVHTVRSSMVVAVPEEAAFIAGSVTWIGLQDFGLTRIV